MTPPTENSPVDGCSRHDEVPITHRLNQRGNRKLNHAIHIAAISQLRFDTEGRAYYERKLAEGKSSKEAIRSLKRRISDRVYRHLNIDAQRASTS